MTRTAPSLEEVDAVFHALAHETRRHLVLTLSHFGGELPSGYLARRFQHSWPTTTRHLGILQRAGVVEVRREGRGSQYRLNRALLTRMSARLTAIAARARQPLPSTFGKGAGMPRTLVIRKPASR